MDDLLFKHFALDFSFILFFFNFQDIKVECPKVINYFYQPTLPKRTKPFVNFLDFQENFSMSIEREYLALSEHVLRVFVHGDFCQFLAKSFKKGKMTLA